MISDDKLIAWLVFWRHQSVKEQPTVAIPGYISAEMERRGWVVCADVADWDGGYVSTFTPLGLAVSDLNAPEYGIDPCPMEMEA